MESVKSRKKWVLVVAGLSLALLVVKAVFFFTAKPKVTVDYVAELSPQAGLRAIYNDRKPGFLA